MNQWLQVYIFFTVLVMIVSGCQTGYTILDNGQPKSVYVTDHKARNLQKIADLSNNTKRLTLLKCNYKSESGDPVYLNFYGSVLLLEGRYEEAIDYFKHSLHVLLENGHSYFSGREELSGRLNTPVQRKGAIRVQIEENRQIVAALSHYFISSDHKRLLEALKKRSGHIPDPPIYKDAGLIGLALESIAESIPYTDFHPKIITYQKRSRYNRDIERISINLVSQNLLTACILTKDDQCLDSALQLIQIYPRYLWILSLENHAAISAFLLSDNNLQQYLNASNRTLFKGLLKDQIAADN